MVEDLIYLEEVEEVEETEVPGRPKKKYATPAGDATGNHGVWY